MTTTERDQLVDKIDSLISASNSWNQIYKWFEGNKYIEDVYLEVRQECWNDQVFGCASIYIAVIERLLTMIDKI